MAVKLRLDIQAQGEQIAVSLQDGAGLRGNVNSAGDVFNLDKLCKQNNPT